MWQSTDLGEIIEFEVDTTSTFALGPQTVRVPTRVWGLGFDRSLDGPTFLIPMPTASAMPLDRLLVVQNWSPDKMIRAVSL